MGSSMKTKQKAESYRESYGTEHSPPDTMIYRNRLFSWLPSYGATATHQRKLRTLKVTTALFLLITYRY